MYSKLYLSGIEINIEASEAVYKTASKLYLSGIEIRYDKVVLLAIDTSKLYLSGIEIGNTCRCSLITSTPNCTLVELKYTPTTPTTETIDLSKLYLSGIEMGAKGADGKQGDLQIVP